MNTFARFYAMMMDREKIPDRPGEVDFPDFMDSLYGQVHGFKTYWARKHVEQPDVFPSILPSKEDWIEQFITWLGTE